MIKSRLSAFRSDRKGSVIVYVALAMPVLVGGMGLGAETGYRYYNQRLLQHAADFAAHAGAVHKYKDETKTEIDVAALNVAVASEYDHTLGTITVNIPPVSGAFTGEPSAVEVILTETRPRLFSAIFSNTPVVIAARAVAAANGVVQPACILALSETASGAITVTGNASVNLTGCAVASNSTASNSFNMQGSGDLVTDCVSSSGGTQTTTNLTLVTCDSPVTNAPPVNDPYSWIKEPDPNMEPSTSNNKVGKLNQTNPPETPIRYKNGLDVKGDVTFAPGLYIIENGNFTVNGTISGSGVTFYFTKGAKANILATGQLNLSAPATGPYAGILFFGGRNDPDEHSFLGNSLSTLTGAIYMPASHVEFSGSSVGGSGCTQIIADTVEFIGNSDLAIDCSDDGTQEINIAELFKLVE
jgi:hypothetical protein